VAMMKRINPLNSFLHPLTVDLDKRRVLSYDMHDERARTLCVVRM
jgi:hypothetical protein